MMYVQKYSWKDCLAEAITIEGAPFFIVKRKRRDPTIAISITLADKVLLPPPQSMYLSRAYDFRSKKEVFDFLERANFESIDTLFRRAKRICSCYVDSDSNHIALLAADILYTYYQDKLGLTHYLFFVGHPGSGKTNNLYVIHYMGYRNFMGSDITSANIFQFLGNMQEGQGTICEDESDNIVYDRAKMRIYKAGYITGVKVPRTDISRGRKQESFYVFGFKAYAAESLPDALRAMGFVDRVIVLKCVNGNPQYDIQEAINPAGDSAFQRLSAELNDFRRLMLAYRIEHYWDKIPDLSVNISNREKQLFKPLLRIFYGSSSFAQVCHVVSFYLNHRREAGYNSWYAFLLRIVMKLIAQMKTHELPSRQIWSTIIEELPEGERISEMTYRSEQFGVITERRSIDTLIEVFGAKHAKRHGQFRRLVFDEAILRKIASRYSADRSFKVKVTGTDGTEIG
jgi:hypothetical protein